MGMFDLQKEGDVFLLRMVAGENRFNGDFIEGLNRALDEVERSQGPAALVTTGEGKFYSNGLDLEWMMEQVKDVFDEHVRNVHKTFLRLLTFPVITVAALNGHVFAAGAMLALAHDYRIMRADRGFFCLPEVDIRVPFTPPMAALIRARLPAGNVVREAMCTGKRYGGDDAARLGIVDRVVPEAEVLPAAVELARGLADKDRDTLAKIKRGMYPEVIEVFEKDGGD
jgi:enoyl-CoA hydratase/carnithine racemase